MHVGYVEWRSLKFVFESERNMEYLAIIFQSSDKILRCLPASVIEK